MYTTLYRETALPKSGWDPPDVPLSALDPKFNDLNGAPLTKNGLFGCHYKFPWYLRFMPFLYALKHYWKTREWPESVLYFSDRQQLDKAIFLDVIQHPQDFYSVSNEAYCSLPEDKEFDELFEEIGGEIDTDEA